MDQWVGAVLTAKQQQESKASSNVASSRKSYVDALLITGPEWTAKVFVISVFTPGWIAYDKYAEWSGLFASNASKTGGGQVSLSCGAELASAPLADADLAKCAVTTPHNWNSWRGASIASRSINRRAPPVLME